VEAWKRGEESKPPADIPVGADTGPARLSAGLLFRDISRLRPEVQVQLRVAALQGAFPIFGTQGTRAAGGPVSAGGDYFVNEPSLGGELFRPATDGFVMNAGDTDRLISGVEALVSGQGGSGVNVTQTIVTADPVVAGSESARKMRDAAFLAGV
jgi:hypothetical protein